MSVFGARRSSAARSGEVVASDFIMAVVEELTEPVVTLGSDGLVRSNRRARGLHGLPPEPLRPEAWAALHHVYEPGSDHVLEAARLPLLRAMGGEEISAVELEIRDADAEVERFAVSAHPIRRGRRVVGALSVLRSQPRPEPSAGLSLPEVLRSAADGIAVICAVTGSFVYVNDAWANALGYAPGELVGHHVSTVNAPSDRMPQEVAGEMLEVLDRGEAWRDEVELRRRDGTVVWWEQTVSALEDGAGRPAWIVVGRDVTARRAAAGALREEARRFRTAFETLPVATAVIDQDGRVLAVNDALAGLTGVRGDELLGRSLEAVLPPVDLAAARALATAGRRGDLSRYAFAARCGASADVVGLTITIVRDVDGRILESVVLAEPVQPSASSMS